MVVSHRCLERARPTPVDAHQFEGRPPGRKAQPRASAPPIAPKRASGLLRPVTPSGADALAERHGRSRARCVEGRQSAAADDDDPTCLAVAATSDSALSRWFHERIERRRGRRKTIIVALARQLLVALWRYVTAGIVIEGATMKA